MADVTNNNPPQRPQGDAYLVGDCTPKIGKYTDMTEATKQVEAVLNGMKEVQLAAKEHGMNAACLEGSAFKMLVDGNTVPEVVAAATPVDGATKKDKADALEAALDVAKGDFLRYAKDSGLTGELLGKGKTLDVTVLPPKAKKQTQRE